MKKRHLGLAALLLAAASAAPAGADEARQVAEASIAQWNSAFAKRKVDDIVSLYAANAMLVRPDGSVSRSPEQIRAFWQSLIAQNNGVFSVGIQDVRGENSDTVITQTILSDVKRLQNTRQVMKYNYEGVLYSVLKRQSDGSWKAQVQQWSHKGRS
jgi:uncharacterized protein (TIGR02246 family)